MDHLIEEMFVRTRKPRQAPPGTSPLGPAALRRGGTAPSSRRGAASTFTMRLVPSASTVRQSPSSSWRILWFTHRSFWHAEHSQILRADQYCPEGRCSADPMNRLARENGAGPRGVRHQPLVEVNYGTVDPLPEDSIWLLQGSGRRSDLSRIERAATLLGITVDGRSIFPDFEKFLLDAIETLQNALGLASLRSNDVVVDTASLVTDILNERGTARE
jgi:hypothetical protein